MASNEVDFVQPQKKSGAAKKFESFRKFLWNPDKKEVLGRNSASWGKIGLFYLILYIALAGWWIALLQLYFLTLDDNYPKLQDGASMLKMNPGMGFRPMPDYESTLIHFEQGKPSSYKVYTDNIRAFVDQYESSFQEGEEFVGCEDNDVKTDKTKVCVFDIQKLGDQCTWSRDYGYDEGKPCVLLKLNKVFNWEPEIMDPSYNESKTVIEARAKYGLTPFAGHVSVTCQGQHPADKENIGPIKFYPEKGFKKEFFPFLNQEGYRSPLVFAQFQNITKGVVVQVWCRAWAMNLQNSNRNLLPGSARFEMLVD